MALGTTEFLAAFPEFRRTDVTLVEAKLAQAERMVSRDRWGSRADDGVGNYAAHLLATSPLAEKSKYVEKTGLTTYLATFERLRKTIATGPLVV